MSLYGPEIKRTNRGTPVRQIAIGMYIRPGGRCFVCSYDGNGGRDDRLDLQVRRIVAVHSLCGLLHNRLVGFTDART